MKSWSWQADGDRLPAGCAPYSGSSSAGVPWSPGLVSVAGGTLRLGAAPPADGRRATGSGIGCTGKAQRYGRVEVRARIPRGAGLVGRIAFWPSAAGQDSGWSGLTVPSADLSPAYATNGCGDRAYGASVPARLAGAFHTYVLTWSPQGMSVSADGRVLYSDHEAFDGPRWVGISLAATGAALARADLLVDRIVVHRWVGPLPAAAPSPGPTPGNRSADASADVPAGTPAAPAAGSGAQDGVAFAALPPSGPAVPGPQEAAPTAGPIGGPRGSSGEGATLVAALATGRPSAPWLVGGSVAAVGVLLGITRAALSSRRRPLTP
jgi:hypothetical protein